MTAKTTRLTTALFVAAAFTASANAEYRCDPAPSWMDRAACEAADKSPDALRQFVQRMDRNRINLEFADYVDLKTSAALASRRTPPGRAEGSERCCAEGGEQRKALSRACAWLPAARRPGRPSSRSRQPLRVLLIRIRAGQSTSTGG